MIHIPPPPSLKAQKPVRSLFLVACLFISITACKKESNSSSNENELVKARKYASARQAFDFNDMPTKEGGMLVFRDDAHFNAYTTFIETYIATPEDETDTTEFDVNLELDAIENSIGFISLRHITEANFAILDADGWNTLEEISEKHFINDLATKSILNNLADYRIGTTLIHYINKDFAVSVPFDQSSLVNEVHNLGSGATIDDIVTLDPNNTLFEIIDLSGNFLRTSFASRATNTPGHFVSKPFPSTPDPCNNPTKIQFDGMIYTALAGTPVPYQQNFKGDFFIDFGDGFSATGTSSQTSNGEYVLSGIMHTYQFPGTYTVTVKARAHSTNNNSSFYDAEESIFVPVPNNCNYTQSKTLGPVWHYTNDGSNRAWSGKVWFNKTNNGHKIGAETHCYHYTNNKWRNSRVDRVVAQYMTTKYIDGDCNRPANDQGADWPRNNNCARSEHTRNNLNAGWVDIWANHRIIVGTQTFSFDQHLLPCP